MSQTPTETGTILDCSTPAERANMALVEGLYRDVVNGRSLDRLPEYLADDFKQHNPVFGEGRSGFADFVGDFFLANFPDLTVTVDIGIAQNDRTLTFTTWRGHKGDEELSVQIADLYRARDGKLVEHWDVVGYPELEPFGITRPTASQPDTEPDRTGTPAQVRNLELLERYITEITIQDTSKAARYIVEDFVQHDPMIPPGLEGFRQCCEIFRTLAPDMKVYPHHMIVGENHVGAIWDWNGHQVGTGNDFILPGADIYRLRDGMLTEHWDVMDYTCVVATLGFHPKTVFMRG